MVDHVPFNFLKLLSFWAQRAKYFRFDKEMSSQFFQKAGKVLACVPQQSTTRIIRATFFCNIDFIYMCTRLPIYFFLIENCTKIKLWLIQRLPARRMFLKYFLLPPAIIYDKN